MIQKMSIALQWMEVGLNLKTGKAALKTATKREADLVQVLKSKKD